MNDLYRNEWRLLTNLFLPSVKLDYKVREGSRLKRVYKDAETPLDRLLKSPHGDRAKLEPLRRLREELDPFELAKGVDRKLQAIWRLASRGPLKPAAPPHRTKSNRPWEDWIRTEDASLINFPPDRDRQLGRILRQIRRDTMMGTV